MLSGLDDPFKTAVLREPVRGARAGSPARFREDANAEEDYALGGYRDRVVAELAQNAADAAARARRSARTAASPAAAFARWSAPSLVKTCCAAWPAPGRGRRVPP